MGYIPAFGGNGNSRNVSCSKPSLHCRKRPREGALYKWLEKAPLTLCTWRYINELHLQLHLLFILFIYIYFSLRHCNRHHLGLSIGTGNTESIGVIVASTNDDIILMAFVLKDGDSFEKENFVKVLSTNICNFVCIAKPVGGIWCLDDDCG